MRAPLGMRSECKSRLFWARIIIFELVKLFLVMPGQYAGIASESNASSLGSNEASAFSDLIYIRKLPCMPSKMGVPVDYGATRIRLGLIS